MWYHSGQGCSARRNHPLGEKGESEDHHDRPDRDHRDADRDVILVGLDRPADRDRARHPTDGAARPQDRAEARVEREDPGGRQVDHQPGGDRHDGRLHEGDRPGLGDQGERERRTEQHDPGLDVVLGPERRLEPLRHGLEVADHEADQQSQKRGAEIEPLHLRPSRQVEDRERAREEDRVAEQELAQVPAHDSHADGEDQAEAEEDREESVEVLGEVGGQLARIGPGARRDRPWLQRAPRPEGAHRENDHEHPQPDGPVVLGPEQTRALRRALVHRYTPVTRGLP